MQWKKNCGVQCCRSVVSQLAGLIADALESIVLYLPIDPDKVIKTDRLKMADEKKKRQQWKQTFDMLDKDKSGGIDAKALRIALKGMGFRASIEDVDTLMREYDAGGSGELEFPEFCEVVAAKEKEAAIAESLGVTQKRSRVHKKKFHMSEDKVAETRRVFDSFDIDGNGFIDMDELSKALRILGFNKTPAEVAAIMSTYDANHSGDLSYNEFLTMVTAENEQLAGMGDRFKSATHNILKELSKTNFTAASPIDMNIENWDTVPIHPPGKPGLKTETTFKAAIWLLGIAQAVIIILFGACCKLTLVDSGDFTNIYMMYSGCVIMLLFGFGYLMTFLKRYGMGSVGFTLMITCIGIQWGLLCEGFSKKLYHTETEPSWSYLEINIYSILEAVHLSASILVSYGAVIGKTSPLQLIVMTLIEAFAYSINKVFLCLGVVEFFDAGGTINIHMFGAYFGLAVAWVLGKPTASAEAEGGHVSDLFSLIGTIFLWVYWPSFNGAVLAADSPGQQRAVVNTVLGLCACTVAAFFWSSILSSTHKFRPVDIQNATLAGGVALGAVCDLSLNLSDALLIGFAGGTISAIGYNHVQEYIEHKFSVHDTCGVHNLHGLPSLVGGIATTVLAAIKGPRGHDIPSPILQRDQAFDQCMAIFLTLGMSISCGLITGYLLALIRTDENITEFYCDEPYWEIMDDFGRSIESTSQKMAKGLEHLQQGLEASATLRQLMSNFHNMEEGTYGAPSSGSSVTNDFSIPVSSKPRKEKGGSLDSSVHY